MRYPPLARDETEIIGPITSSRATFELLRAYHVRSWRDERNRWHVVIPTSRLAEIEECEKQARAAASETMQTHPQEDT